jgi:PIN domain nuclease of toxin-antitoxin system
MSVLDASAILAFLFKEVGAERVRPLLATSLVFVVNWAEVLGLFTRDGHDVQAVEQQLLGLGLTCVPIHRSARDCHSGPRAMDSPTWAVARRPGLPGTGLPRAAGSRYGRSRVAGLE